MGRYSTLHFSKCFSASLLHESMHAFVTLGRGRVSFAETTPTLLLNRYLSYMLHDHMLFACVTFHAHAHRARAHARHAFVSGMRAGETLAGMRLLRAQEVPDDVLSTTVPFGALICKKLSIRQPPAEGMCSVHMPPPRALFFNSFNKHCIGSCGRYAHLSSYGLSGGSGQSSARAPVLSAPVRSHAMALWGPHAAPGAASATSAPLADLGSSPMSAE